LSKTKTKTTSTTEIDLDALEVDYINCRFCKGTAKIHEKDNGEIWIICENCKRSEMI